MRFEYIPKMIKAFMALLFCVPAILMPYRIRMGYIKMLSFLVHLPYFLFGAIVRFLFKKLSINQNDINWK